MPPFEDFKKWVTVAERVTSTTAIIILVFWLIWQNTGDRAKALEAAKANAQDAAGAAREAVKLLEGHTKLSSEETAIGHMIWVQICLNTAKNREEINQCLNFR